MAGLCFLIEEALHLKSLNLSSNSFTEGDIEDLLASVSISRVESIHLIGNLSGEARVKVPLVF